MDKLPKDYGYVIFTAMGSQFVNGWLAWNVVKARKKYNVKYPIMYSNENGGENMFNCIQRAHQNPLENYPAFLAMLLIAGIEYPRLSAGAGCVYILGKIAYAKGYYSGSIKTNPELRKYGIISYPGILPLLGCCLKMAYDNLTA